MKKLILLTSLICLLFTNAALAHHSRANFDSEQTAVLSGTITDYAWRNPHVYIEIKADDASGVSQIWLVEAHSVTGMANNGWDKDTLKVGEQVTLSGSPDKNPKKHFILVDYVQKSDGKKLYAFKASDTAQVAAKILPSEDFSGTWSLDMRRFNVRLAGGPPPADWEYSDLAKEAIAHFDYEQNPENECLPIGVPRISIYPYGTNFTRVDGGLRIDKEHMNEHRMVWFDRNAEALKNQPASYVGSSYGHFESDRHLVIESWGFLPTKWGIANGVDSSTQKTVVEDYVLSDDGFAMELTITITDPVYLKSPVVQTAGYIKGVDRQFIETPCDPIAASRHIILE